MRQNKNKTMVAKSTDLENIQNKCRAFDKVYRDYYKKSLRYAIKKLGPYKREDAEDIVSSVWIKLLSKTQENPGMYAHILNIEAYINTMIRNKIIDASRSPKYKLTHQIKSTNMMNTLSDQTNHLDNLWFKNQAFHEIEWNNDWIIAKICLKKYCLKQSLLCPEKANLLQDYFVHQYSLDELQRKYRMFKKPHISLIIHRFYEYFKSQKSFYEIKFTEIF